MTDESNAAGSDPHLLQLVLSLEAAAMQQMGKLQNPFTGEVEKNLDVAKNSIDMLSMIERKTQGNLSEEESSLIKRSLYQLRMNYVDELKAEKESGQAEKPPESADSEGGTEAAPGVETGETGDSD